MTDSSVPLAVVVCTKNEGLNIAQCLESLSWAGQVFVVDSSSDDETPAVARSFGATVVNHEWEGYSAQKNWALEHLPFEGEWVLFLDADERVSPELAAEIQAVIHSRSDEVAFFLPRRMIFLGRWLKRTWLYPDYNLRLFRRGHGRFEDRSVHETVLVDGPCGYMKSDIIHDDQRDIATYVSRLNRYSSLEAREMLLARDGSRSGRLKPSFRGHWTERRRALKEWVWYRIPFKPVVRLVWCLLIRRGLLDGRPGVVFAGLAAFNDWMQDVKAYELRLMQEGRRKSHLAPPSLKASSRQDETSECPR